MAESRLLDEDRDEWFYQTMNKYSNLYMFELEFPLESIEVINEASLCISGTQTFSKKCELLQLCVPPKLLRSEDEGLCKDRDFKILSGGYAQGKILQMKALKKSPNLIATSQDGYGGIIIYEVGNDDRATILEKHRFPTENSTTEMRKSLCCMNDSLLLATPISRPTEGSNGNSGIIINDWKIEDGWSQNISLKSNLIWKQIEFKCGEVSKILPWDNNTCIFLTSTGTIGLYDLRSGSPTPSIFFHASKSPNNASTPSEPHSIAFTFDCLPESNKIGVLDSYGGYETYDPRSTSSESGSSSTSSVTRCILPEFSDSAGVYRDWFNIEYEKSTKMRENEMARFIISGLKRESVPVIQEAGERDKLIGDNSSVAPDKKKSVEPVFSHDGHSKPVSHAIWHPVAKDLVFSASIDAVLHAWQFIPEK